jgi:hypothetical protein
VYSAADAPKVLFRRIEDCAEIAILGRNSYTNRQLLQNAICLLLTTGLYVRAFEEWDHLQPAAQTLVALRTMIQEAFQRRLNATAPTAGHHGCAPALPYQNAFGALAEDDDNEDGEESIAESVSNHLAALTYQSQMTVLTVATTRQRNSQQLANIKANQQATHSTLHQIIAQLNAVTFNASDAGRGNQAFQATHREAEVKDKVFDEAHRSTGGGVSLISTHPKDEHSHLLHREADFPKDLAVNKVAQQGPRIHTISICSPRRNQWRTARSTAVLQPSRHARTNSNPPTAFFKCNEKICELECMLVFMWF